MTTVKTRTIYYVWRGFKISDDMPSEAAAVALAVDGDEIYRETISGSRHERTRIWPTPTETQDWDDLPRQYHD